MGRSQTPIPSRHLRAPNTDVAQWRPVAHVANVAWPAPGECFRMVHSGFNGYPMRCPTSPRWRGTFVNPRGERWPVEACDEHVGDVHRPVTSVA